MFLIDCGKTDKPNDSVREPSTDVSAGVYVSDYSPIHIETKGVEDCLDSLPQSLSIRNVELH